MCDGKEDGIDVDWSTYPPSPTTSNSSAAPWSGSTRSRSGPGWRPCITDTTATPYMSSPPAGASARTSPGISAAAHRWGAPRGC